MRWESVTACFTDDTGEAFSYSVLSDNPNIADASVRGEDIIITGYNPGETRLTITATSSAGSGETSFPVVGAEP